MTGARRAAAVDTPRAGRARSGLGGGQTAPPESCAQRSMGRDGGELSGTDTEVDNVVSVPITQFPASVRSLFKKFDKVRQGAARRGAARGAAPAALWTATHGSAGGSGLATHAIHSHAHLRPRPDVLNGPAHRGASAAARPTPR